MYALPADLRKSLSDYIQSNPSPNVAVGSCIQLVMALQNLKPVAATEEEEFATPGNSEEESTD